MDDQQSYQSVVTWRDYYKSEHAGAVDLLKEIEAAVDGKMPKVVTNIELASRVRGICVERDDYKAELNKLKDRSANLGEILGQNTDIFRKLRDERTQLKDELAKEREYISRLHSNISEIQPQTFDQLADSFQKLASQAGQQWPPPIEAAYSTQVLNPGETSRP